MRHIKNIMKRNRIIFILLYFVSTLYSVSIKTIDELKIISNWKFDSKWSCAKNIENVNGNIKLYFDSSGMNDMALYRVKVGNINLEGMTKIRLLMESHSSKSFYIAVALVTEAGNKWWELPIKEVKEGENFIEYKLSEDLFATKDNGWINSLQISGENNIKEIGFVIYPFDNFSGVVILKNFEIEIDPLIILEKQKEEKMYEEFESFEDDNPWEAALWSGASSIEYSYEIVSEGNRSIAFKYINSGEHVFYWYFDKDKDISYFDKLRLDIYSPEENAKQIRINFMTGKNFSWHQSKYYDISPGWNKNYTINITEGWTPPLDTFMISGIAIHIISIGKGEVYIDNLRLKRKEGSGVGKIDWQKKFKETFGRW